MRRKRSKVVASVVAAVVAASALTGCSIPIDRNPPPAALEAVDAAVAQVRDLNGVESASANYRVDRHEDGLLELPSEWSVDIDVMLRPDASDLEDVASELHRAIAQMAPVIEARGALSVPEDASGPEARLTFGTGTTVEAPETSVAAMGLLRRVAGVTLVSLDHGVPSAVVGVASPAQWGEVAAEFRQFSGFGSDALQSIVLSTRSSTEGFAGRLSIDANSPTPQLINAFSEFVVRASVSELEYNLLQPFGDGSGRAHRPSLRVEVVSQVDVANIVAEFAALDDPSYLAAGQPRATLTVMHLGGEPTVYEGYLGLPPGSAEPDDLSAIEPSLERPAADREAVVAVLDAAGAASRLEADRLAIEALLTDAGDTAGIQGAVSVALEACAAGAGQKVQAVVVVPIFEIADSAQDAFDAITASWVADGLSRSDRAMGTDFYSADDRDAVGAQRLGIRGTAGGIEITAAAACVVSR